MTKIEWDDSLSVGVELIDDQHKMLIQRISDLSKAVSAGQGPSEIMKVLGFMMDYTDFHFSTEEKHMERLGFPGKDGHMKQHKEFIGMIQSLDSDFREEGATQQLSSSINTFLIDWLINHIKVVDCKFGEFLQEKGFSETE